MGDFGFRNVGQKVHIIDKTTHEMLQAYSPIVYTDDFLGAAVAIPAAASPESGVEWVKKIVGAAPPTLVGKADATNGVIECALTSASQKQEATAYWNDELLLSVTQGLVFEARFAASVLPTDVAECVVGLIGAWADGPDATTYNLFVTLDGSGEIFCEKDDNATDESATSDVTLTASEYAIVRIDCTDVADVKFFINGARVASGTTFDWAASAANSKVQPFFGCYKADDVGVCTLLVDYIKITQNRS